MLTYNRKDLLMGCIESILAQKRPLDGIIVIDNHSTDGTVEAVQQRFPSVTVHRQERNRGSAGGFREALRAGYEAGYDWIWLMDDDIELLPEALETLLSYQHVSRFIQGRRVGREGLLHLEAFWDASSGTCLTLNADTSFERTGRNWIPVQWCCFEGPLIHRSVVDLAGLPDERFFLSGDDMAYGLVASFYTTVIYVRDVILNRKLPVPTTIPPMRLYLAMRNRFIMAEHVQSFGVPISKHTLRFSGLLMASWYTRFVLSGRNHPVPKWQCLKMVYLGLIDGWRGRFDRLPFLKTS